MKILVCGGRDYRDRKKVAEILGKYDDDTILIHGAARGADTLAHEYGLSRGWVIRAYPAKWEHHGKAAGPLRNQEMIDKEKPDVVIAFPGGRGTMDMVRRAKDAACKVIVLK